MLCAWPTRLDIENTRIVARCIVPSARCTSLSAIPKPKVTGSTPVGGALVILDNNPKYGRVRYCPGPTVAPSMRQNRTE